MYTLSNYVKNVVLLIKLLRYFCLFFIILDVRICGTISVKLFLFLLC
jgi:hypothetical protein